jgi:hypothetical protein
MVGRGFVSAAFGASMEFAVLFSLPGAKAVTSHVDLLSSNETKIAPRSTRIAAGISGRAIVFTGMLISRVRFVATSFCHSAGRYPLIMGSEVRWVPPQSGTLKRRTIKIRVFPGETFLLRLASAVLVEIDEKWASENKAYINRECQNG